MKEVHMKQDWSQIENWAGIFGKWRVDGKSVSYSATDSQAAFSFGIAIGSGRSRNGSIAATIDLGKKHNANEARLIFGYDPLTRDYFSAGLGGYGGAYAIDQFEQGFGWRNLVLAGVRDNLDENKTFNVRVDILGNQVTLWVDDVLVVCWLNNARNSLPDLVERSRVGYPLKTGDQPCVVESQRNFS